MTIARELPTRSAAILEQLRTKRSHPVVRHFLTPLRCRTLHPRPPPPPFSRLNGRRLCRGQGQDTDDEHHIEDVFRDLVLTRSWSTVWRRVSNLYLVVVFSLRERAPP